MTPQATQRQDLHETPDQKKAREKHEAKEAAAQAKVAAQEAAKATREAEKEKNKELREIRTHNNKMQILASKTITVLQAIHDELKKQMAGNTFKQAPGMIQESCNEAFKTAVEYLSEAEKIVKDTKAAAKTGRKMATLSFAQADLPPATKAIRDSITKLQKLGALVG